VKYTGSGITEYFYLMHIIFKIFVGTTDVYNLDIGCLYVC